MYATWNDAASDRVCTRWDRVGPCDVRRRGGQPGETNRTLVYGSGFRGTVVESHFHSDVGRVYSGYFFQHLSYTLTASQPGQIGCQYSGNVGLAPTPRLYCRRIA